MCGPSCQLGWHYEWDAACTLYLRHSQSWAHPSQAANIVWLIIFGWAAALGHLFAAIIQACTIVGIGTAITNLQLMVFALCALRPRRPHVAVGQF